MKKGVSRRVLLRVGIAWLSALACLGERIEADPAKPPSPPVDEVAPPKFLAAFGSKGTGDGQFNAPIGIAVGPAEDLFVTDNHNNRVERFSRDGKFLDKFPTGSFPGGIAVDREGLIYVAAMMDYKISVYRRKGKPTANGTVEGSEYELVREWGKKGTADGEFDQPGGLAFGRDGSIYVCDQVNHRMQRFTPEGKFLAKWGEYGDAPGQFGKPEPPTHRVGGPCLAAIDRDGNIFTTEPTAGRIQKFSPDGKYIAHWGSNEARVGAFGGNERLRGPIALLFDKGNRLWVSSTNHRVQLFTPEGKYLTGLGTTAKPSDATGQFNVPHGMALDKRGVLYVADTLNHRVQMFQ